MFLIYVLASRPGRKLIIPDKSSIYTGVQANSLPFKVILIFTHGTGSYIIDTRHIHLGYWLLLMICTTMRARLLLFPRPFEALLPFFFLPHISQGCFPGKPGVIYRPRHAEINRVERGQIWQVYGSILTSLLHFNQQKNFCTPESSSISFNTKMCTFTNTIYCINEMMMIFVMQKSRNLKGFICFICRLSIRVLVMSSLLSLKRLK